MYLKKIILFLLLITTAYNRTDKYYTHCESNAPKSGFITHSDCNGYAQEDSYCCLLYYVSNPDIQFNFYFKKANTNTNATIKGEEERILSERENLCIGLTNDGYNKIEDVIKELEKESGIEEIFINCLGTKININTIISIILLILF